MVTPLDEVDDIHLGTEVFELLDKLTEYNKMNSKLSKSFASNKVKSDS